MIVGSFLVYCGQTATHEDHDAMVADAGADPGACCTQPASFVKLSEGDLMVGSGSGSGSGSGGGLSAPIAVGAYREVVVYFSSAPADPSCRVIAVYRPDGATPFGEVSQIVLQGNSTGTRGGRFQVEGSDLRLRIEQGPTSTSCTGAHFIVAGVQ